MELRQQRVLGVDIGNDMRVSGEFKDTYIFFYSKMGSHSEFLSRRVTCSDTGIERVFWLQC